MSQHEPHPAAIPPERLQAECEQRRQRRSGPGGQHRNKVETAVVLTHMPSGVRAEASERRSQAENLRVALARLRLKLAIEVRRDYGTPPAPSNVWLSRVRGGRISVATAHVDFATLLAELLDYLYSIDFELGPAAEYFGVSSSQLVKLLRQHAPALEYVNQNRMERGVNRLS